MTERDYTAEHSDTFTETVRPRGKLSEIKTGYVFLLLRILLIAVIAWVIFTKVFLITQITGNNMFPSVKDGDLAIVFRLHRNYAKNDVVLYTYNGKRYVGRIAALEHDVVALSDSGILQVNGTEQNGEILYPTYAEDTLDYPHTVSDGCVFILDDYRTAAHDSRERGDVPLEYVDGKIISLFRRRSL